MIKQLALGTLMISSFVQRSNAASSIKMISGESPEKVKERKKIEFNDLLDSIKKAQDLHTLATTTANTQKFLSDYRAYIDDMDGKKRTVNDSAATRMVEIHNQNG